MIKHPERNVCNRDQKSFLLTELGKLNKSNWDWPKRDLPPRLEAARKRLDKLNRQIERFNKLEDKRVKREVDDWQRRMSAARELVYFGTPDEALAAVTKLQMLYEAISTREG